MAHLDEVAQPVSGARVGLGEVRLLGLDHSVIKVDQLDIQSPAARVRRQGALVCSASEVFSPMDLAETSKDNT